MQSWMNGIETGVSIYADDNAKLVSDNEEVLYTC